MKKSFFTFLILLSFSYPAWSGTYSTISLDFGRTLNSTIINSATISLSVTKGKIHTVLLPFKVELLANDTHLRRQIIDFSVPSNQVNEMANSLCNKLGLGAASKIEKHAPANDNEVSTGRNVKVGMINAKLEYEEFLASEFNRFYPNDNNFAIINAVRCNNF